MDYEIINNMEKIKKISFFPKIYVEIYIKKE